MLAGSPLAQDFLRYAKFQIEIRATGRMILPAYKGSVFRGALGSAFRKNICPALSKACPTCPVHEQCLYVAYFEPSALRGQADAGKFNQPPRPYVLNPPLGGPTEFRPGGLLRLELVLMGQAMEALAYFISAFVSLGKTGVGRRLGPARRRGGYDVLNVHCFREDTPLLLYDGVEHALVPLPTTPTVNEVHEFPTMASLTLDFRTPLRLKTDGKLVQRLTFPLLFERLVHRLSLLAKFYGSDRNFPDLSELVRAARHVRVSSDELHWHDWQRYSRRQKTTMKLGGLRGRITFAGELAPFVPYLRLGESVNVGNGTTFGLGKYVLSPAVK